ncbi:unnamed protein product, partial [Iphiclides podalirius]
MPACPYTDLERNWRDLRRSTFGAGGRGAPSTRLHRGIASAGRYRNVATLPVDGIGRVENVRVASQSARLDRPGRGPLPYAADGVRFEISSTQ